MSLQIERLESAHYLPPTSCRAFRVMLHERVDVHWHDFYEMALVLAGEGIHLLNGVAHPLAAGSFFLLTPADFHELRPRPGTPLELINIIFGDELLEQEIRQLLFDRLHDHIAVFDGAAFDLMHNEFERLWLETQSPRVGQHLAMRGALQRILIDLARYEHAQRPPSEDSAIIQQPAIRRAVMYMHHHFRQPLALHDVAQHAHLSPNYFSECFHRSMGVVFQLYLQQLRLRFARSMLAVSEISITDICYASGFNSLSHFQRAFKQAYGQSPRAVRQRSLRQAAPGDHRYATTQA